MSLCLNDTTFSAECQGKLQRLCDRILYKEELKFSVEQIYSNSTHLTPESKNFEWFVNCGKFLTIDNETGKILKANFCKQRLCPVCNYVKSSVTWHKINACVQWLKENIQGVQFIFMTLTVENCKGEELNNTINHLMASFRKLTNRKTWQRSIVGAIRGLEITYNKKMNTFHPHIHILCAVPADYFSADSDKYITIEKLRQWWTESAELDYFVQVDIEAINQTDNAVAEVAKYAVKMSDILSADIDNRLSASQIVYDATYGRRLIATMGYFRKAIKALNLSDLDEFEDIPSNSDSKGTAVRWNFKTKKFTIMKL